MESAPKHLTLRVPTFYGHVPSRARDSPEFAAPFVPVLIQRADGVRIVLGTHEYDNMSFPDIHVERRPNGWAVFLHPVGDGDPSGFVYFLDDGRSFIVPETGGSTDAVRLVDSLADVPLLDTPRPLDKR